MKKMKFLAIIVVIVAFVVTLIILPGCKADTAATTAAAETTAAATTAAAETTAAATTAAAETEAPKTYKIVNLWLGMGAPYCPPYKAAFEAGCTEKGWDLVFFDGEFDAALQASQMDEAIAMKPDLIILCCLDAAGMEPGIKKAFDAGIPVLADHSQVAQTEYTIGYTGPDDYTEGLIAGEMMNTKLGGKGNVVIITGAAGQDAAIKRPGGFKDKLVELKSEIKVLAEQPADWDKAKATAVMADWITRFGDEIDGVYGADDTLAMGSWVALEEAGYKKGDVIIVGSCGSKEGLAGVKAGFMYGTSSQSPVVGAQKAIEVIKMALEQNIKPPSQLDPYLNFMPLPPITIENVDQFLPGDW